MSEQDEEKQKNIEELLRDAAIKKYGLESVMKDVDAVKPFIEQIKSSLEQIKAAKGILRGDDGKTPEFGVDFFPEEQQRQLLEAITPKKGLDYRDGEDGDTPVNGVDYFTEKEKDAFKKEITPVKGRDYFTPAEVADIKVAVTPVKGRDYRDGKDGSDADPMKVIEVIKSLKGEAAAAFSQAVGPKIDISHVRNAGQFIFNNKKYKTEELMHGSGENGTVLEIDTGTGLTGGPIKTTGTISLDAKLAPMDSLAGNALKILRVNAGATAVEYVTPNAGTVTSVSGTSNRISVTNGSTTPVIDIDAAYVGQTSITTLGTITTGTWAARVNPRVVSMADATSFTPTSDTADENIQTNTQVAGTLTANNPSGTPVDGQFIILRIKCTNAQTFSWGTQYRGSNTVGLPPGTTGSAKTDYFRFIFNSADTKWDCVSVSYGY